MKIAERWHNIAMVTADSACLDGNRIATGTKPGADTATLTG